MFYIIFVKPRSRFVLNCSAKVFVQQLYKLNCTMLHAFLFNRIEVRRPWFQSQVQRFVDDFELSLGVSVCVCGSVADW